jgi:hypothetical protein
MARRSNNWKLIGRTRRTRRCLPGSPYKNRVTYLRTKSNGQNPFRTKFSLRSSPTYTFWDKNFETIFRLEGSNFLGKKNMYNVRQRAAHNFALWTTMESSVGECVEGLEGSLLQTGQRRPYTLYDFGVSPSQARAVASDRWLRGTLLSLKIYKLF